MKRMIKAGVTVVAVAVGFQIMTPILGGQAVASAEVNDEASRQIVASVNIDQPLRSSTRVTSISATTERNDDTGFPSFNGPSYRGE
ncbi:MAG: hypothetical protein HYS14_07475 [Candidatus Rokubacteria bacterium]|nr:hypothetical protein [Candidatus Rokubacteria bacterium]